MGPKSKRADLPRDRLAAGATQAPGNNCLRETLRATTVVDFLTRAEDGYTVNPALVGKKLIRDWLQVSC
ncbi:MAG: hypothetical protein C5B51_12020 [Terriglobia bacterium]|nr:MAG: hypothetical protein C5B51_12020 [Terriglobia bacterium]